MPYGITPTQWALRDTANILGEGLSGIGRNRLAQEELGLKRALQERQLSREMEADQRAKQEWEMSLAGKKVQAEQQKAQLERLNTDVTAPSLWGNNIAGATHWLNVPSSGEPMLIEKFSDMMGTKYDTKEQSPTRGKFVKADGTPLKWKDIEPRWQEVGEMIASNTDPIKLLDSQIMQGKLDINKLKAQGVKANDPRMQGLMQKVAGWEKVIADPDMRTKVLERHRDTLSKFGNPDAKKQVERMDRQIDEARKEARELKKFELGEAGKDRRAQLAADSKIKAAKEVSGRKEKKQSPQDAAQVKMLQSEYNSNLRVIESYRKGDENTTPEKAAAARRNNIEIARKIKKIGLPEQEAAPKNLDPLGLFEDEEEEE